MQRWLGLSTSLWQLSWRFLSESFQVCLLQALWRLLRLVKVRFALVKLRQRLVLFCALKFLSVRDGHLTWPRTLLTFSKTHVRASHIARQLSPFLANRYWADHRHCAERSCIGAFLADSLDPACSVQQWRIRERDSILGTKMFDRLYCGCYEAELRKLPRLIEVLQIWRRCSTHS